MKKILGACLLICLPLLFTACTTEENLEKTVSGLITELLYDNPGIRITLKTEDGQNYNLLTGNVRYSELAWGQRIQVTFRYDEEGLVYSTSTYREVPRQDGLVVIEEQNQIEWYRIVSYRVLESAPRLPIREEKAIDLSGDSIYWTIEPSNLLHEKPEYIEEFREEIEGILSDPRGWTGQTNLRFIYVENQEQRRSDWSLIVFRDTYIDEGLQYDLCGEHRGCVTNDTTERKRKCIVAVSPYLGTFHSGNIYISINQGVINHEVGHCFGFPHFGRGVMSPSRPDGFPSQREIEILKQYREQLQTP